MVALLGCLALAVVLLGASLGYTQTFSVGWTDTGTDPIADGLSLNDILESGLDVTLSTGTVTDQLENITIDKTNLKGVIVVVTGNSAANVVIKTNSSGAPDDTWTFPAGGGRFLWDNTSPLANPLTAAITKVYISSSGAQTPRIRMRALYHTT